MQNNILLNRQLTPENVTDLLYYYLVKKNNNAASVIVKVLGVSKSDRYGKQ